MKSNSYKDSGVDIEKGAAFASGIYDYMRRTFDERVIENPGGFAALFSLDYDKRLFRRRYRKPVLVASTDSVGTKLKIAFMTARHNTVGIDLVAMCANDILVQGAEPLFFLDYIGCSALEPEVHTRLVAGISEGCRQADCALLGGETAELPGFYKRGEYDVAGFVVGIVEKPRLITGSKVRSGDLLVGLPSSGIHSNGYSLVRKIFFEQQKMSPDDSLAEFGIDRTLADELLEPTRIYVRPVRKALNYYRVKQTVRGIAHITGGGLVDNIPRMLPEGCAAEVDPSLWHCPRIFQVVQKLGKISTEEMYHVFNMGIGLVLAVSPYYAESVVRKLRKAGEEAAIIGRVSPGKRTVTIL